MPAVVSFLGYDPFAEAVSFGARLRAARRRCGLTQKKLARGLGTTQAVVSLLETGGEIMNPRVLAAVQAFVDGGDGV